MPVGKRVINRTKKKNQFAANAIKQRTMMRELIEGVETKRPKFLFTFGGDEAEASPDDGPVGTGDIQLNQKLEIAIKFPNETPYPFHIGVWRLCCPSSQQARLMVTRNNRIDEHDTFREEILITFDDPEAQKDSIAWWDAYKTRHGNIDGSMLPRLSEGQSFTGNVISTKTEDDYNTPDEWSLFHTWVWMVKNTTGKIYWADAYWFFEDSSEMCQFKLASPIQRDPYNF